MSDAPHPWTYHDPGETEATPRVTDDNGDEVTIGRAWQEVQRLRSAIANHKRAKTPKTPDAKRLYGPPNMTNVALWGVLDEPGL